MQNKICHILNYLSQNIRELLKPVFDTSDITEIRLRCGKPLVVCKGRQSFAVSRDRRLISDYTKGYIVTPDDVKFTFKSACENSVYAHLEEIRQGFITIKGGHRAGFCGRGIMDGGRLENFRDISSINIRVAHEVKGFADFVMPHILSGSTIDSTLVIAPPLMGKTTMLRDMTRQISDLGIKVGLVDERGEIAALYKGEAQNDIGLHTDIIENTPKQLAVVMLLRTMAPQVIVTDEVATEEEVKALLYAQGTGVSLVASAHGESLEEVMDREVLKPLFRAKAFKKAVLLNKGVVQAI